MTGSCPCLLDTFLLVLHELDSSYELCSPSLRGLSDSLGSFSMNSPISLLSIIQSVNQKIDTASYSVYKMELRRIVINQARAPEGGGLASS